MKKCSYVLILIILFSTAYGSTLVISQDADQSNDTIIYAIPYDFNEYSIYTADSYATRQWNSAVYASLLKRSSVNYDWEPDLANTMPSVSADGLTFSFTLKDDLKFSNGNELTTDDVKFSFRVALSPAVNTNFYDSLVGFLNNDSIKVINSKTIEFTLLKQYTFPYTILSFPIVDEQFFEDRYDRCLEGVEKDCTWNNVNGIDVVSAGPFMIDNIDNEQEIVTAIANPNYYDADNIFTNKIIFQMIADKNEAISALVSGSIDILDSQYVPGLNELNNIDGIWEEFTGDLSSFQFSLNHLNPYYGTGEAIPGNENATEVQKFGDALLIRKAMSHIVDREFAVNEIFEGLARAAATTMPEASIGFDERLIPREYSIETARNYMEEAGFDFADLGTENSDGTFNQSFFEITMLTLNTGPGRNQWEGNFVLELPKIGIGVKEHKTTGWGEIIPRISGSNGLPGSYEEGGYDIFAVGYGWDLDWNPSGLYEDIGRCDTGDCSNFLNFDLGENMTNVAKLVQDYLSELDFDKRISKVKLVQAEIYKWIPEIPVLYPRSHWGYNKEINGVDTLLLASSAQDWARVNKKNFSSNTPSLPEMKPSLEFPIDIKLLIGFVVAVILITYTIYYRRKKRKRKKILDSLPDDHNL